MCILDQATTLFSDDDENTEDEDKNQNTATWTLSRKVTYLS